MHSVRAKTAPLSVAPMIDVTDRHYRWFLRQITQHTLLYTEMIVTRAIEFGDRQRLLGFDELEHPVALQLGGDDATRISDIAKIGEDFGYDEININVGCPSDRVQSGHFGACLMKTPDVVAQCVEAMRKRVEVPVTVKCRIGVDDMDTYEHLRTFADAVVNAGADRITVHARKAWLKGLSPKQNRNVPPLRPAEVHRLKQELGDFPVEINGGIADLDTAEEHLKHVDAVMIGRGVWNNPWILHDADERFFGGAPQTRTREDVALAMIPYIEHHMARGVAIQHLVRHVGPLYTGCVGAKAWRQTMATARHLPEPDKAIQVGLERVAAVVAQKTERERRVDVRNEAPTRS